MITPKLIRDIALVSISVISVSAFAEDMEEIVVTGSYIKGSPEDSASPIQVITRADIDIQSAVTIDDITKNLTINSGTTTNYNFDTENATIAGKANVNLRGLGLNSTLVLFNGKRQVVAAAETQDGSEFVDVNTIPMVMLERVEILKDGGSALYGSDAIAGVVNFILRDDYEGIQIAGDVTSSDRADAEDLTFSALWGTSFNDGKSHFVIGGEYFERDPYSFLDIDLVDSPERVTNTVNEISVMIPGAIPGIAQINPAYINPTILGLTGRFEFTDPLCAQQGYFTGLFSDPANDPNQHCRTDNRPFRGVQIEQERVSLMASFKHEFSDAAEFYSMVQYYDQDIARPRSGTFGSIDNLNAFLPVSDPLWGLGSRAPSVIAAGDAALAATVAALSAQAQAAAIAGDLAGAAAIAASIPAQAGAALVGGRIAAMPTPANAPILTANGGPNALTTMNHKLTQHGDFSLFDDDAESESKTSGITLGLRGDFEAMGGRAMTYDVSMVYTKTETYREEQTVNRTRLELAQNGLGGQNCVPNGVDDYDLNADAGDAVGGGVFGGGISFLFTNPAPGYVLNLRRTISQAVTSTNQGVGDCQFLNPFLTKETTLPNDPALLSWIYENVALEDRENDLMVFDMVVTSELFDMNGGTAHGAIGYQRRDGNNQGNAYPLVEPGLQDFLTYGANPTFLYVSDDHFYGAFTKQFDNDREVDAVFGEMMLPVTDDIEVQLAVRWEDYGGTIGSKTTPKIAVRWQAMDNLALRSSFSQAFRAPNTGVIFKGVGFDGQAATDLLAKQAVRAGTLAPVLANSEVVGIIQAGQASPNIGNEEADTFNIGAIWTPNFAEDLTITLDYYRFDFTDKVVNAPPSVTLATELVNFQAAAADPTNYIDVNTFAVCAPGSSADCVVNPTAYATLGVQRSPTGALQVVDFFNINAGSIETSGVDIAVRYAINTDYGVWNMGVEWSHIIEFVPDDIPGFENGIFGLGVKDGAGTSGDGGVVRSMPEDKANFTLNFSRNNHSVTGIVRYVSGYDNLGAEVFNSGTNPPKTRFDENIDSFTTLDMQYNYLWNWGDGDPLSLTIGAVNATDEDPPRRDDYEQSYDSSTVDPRGRRFYVRFLQAF
ncbi:MAG: iron complex outermembrane receptor protein [Candidatus Azotimanducaceae bacterium]|jgi:iron complex outermembrane receptor protein